MAFWNRPLLVMNGPTVEPGVTRKPTKRAASHACPHKDPDSARSSRSSPTH